MFANLLYVKTTFYFFIHKCIYIYLINQPCYFIATLFFIKRAEKCIMNVKVKLFSSHRTHYFSLYCKLIKIKWEKMFLCKKQNKKQKIFSPSHNFKSLIITIREGPSVAVALILFYRLNEHYIRENNYPIFYS